MGIFYIKRRNELFLLPEDLIDEVYEDASAERLVEAIFGKMNELKDE